MSASTRPSSIRPNAAGRRSSTTGRWRKHRRANIRIADAKPFAEDIDFGAERAGKTRAERLRIELDLGERQGVLTVVDKVENIAHAAVGMMRNALSNAAGETAEAIAKATGIEAQVIRPHIRAFERLALAAFVRGMTENGVVDHESLAEQSHDHQAHPG